MTTMKYIQGKEYKITIKEHDHKNASYQCHVPSSEIVAKYDYKENDGLYANCECCGKETKNYHAFYIERGEADNEELVIGTECIKKYVTEL